MHLLPATAINEAVAVLKAGGVIAHATETCYGLACDLGNPDAVSKLFDIKQRPRTQPVSALFASVEQAKEYVEWNEEAERLAALHLPGPLTLILPLKVSAPTPLHAIAEGVSTTIGVRISPNPVAVALVTALGRPISTTSANIHGEKNPYSAQVIMERFARETHQPDIVLDSGELAVVPPSTIMDLASGGDTRRQGNLRP